MGLHNKVFNAGGIFPLFLIIAVLSCSKGGQDSVGPKAYEYGDFSPLSKGRAWTYVYHGEWNDSIQGRHVFCSVEGKKVFKVTETVRNDHSTDIEVVEDDSALTTTLFRDSAFSPPSKTSVHARLRYSLRDSDNVIAVNRFDSDTPDYFGEFLFPTVVPWFYFHFVDNLLLEDPFRLRFGQDTAIYYDLIYDENDARNQTYEWKAGRGLVTATYRDSRSDRLEMDSLVLANP